MSSRDVVIISLIGATGVAAYFAMPWLVETWRNIFKLPWEPPEADVADMHWSVVNPSVYIGQDAQVIIRITTTSSGIFQGKARLDLRNRHDWHDDPPLADIYVPSGQTREYTLSTRVRENWNVGDMLDFRIELQGIWDVPGWPFDKPGIAYYPSSEGVNDVFTIVG